MGGTGFSAPGSSKDAQPKDAGTVLVLRDRAPDQIEVFLVRRHGRSGFMAGAFVFPGGKVDAADSSEELLIHVPSSALERIQALLPPVPGRTPEPRMSLGLHVAAIRELFEEAGVLLARRRDGRPLTESDRPWLEADRRLLSIGETTLAAILTAEELELELDALIPWGHWITPSAEPKRFDTWFFLCILPPGQTVSHDERETVEEKWLTPREALAEQEAGRIFLPPPTLLNLDELASFSSTAEVAARARSQERRIAPVLPKLTNIEGRVTILMPWDPLYDATPGESLSISSPHPLARQISRVMLDGVRWTAGKGG